MTHPPPASPFDLSGRTALVTGCSRGIGRAITEALAHAGADIVGVSTSLPDDGGETGAAVREKGRAFRHYRTDLGEREAVAGLIARLDEADERIDILVNNAGIIRREPLVSHSDADWDDVLAVNLTAPFQLARDLGAKMVARGSGKIVFLASVLSFQGGLTVPGYAATKGAVANLVKSFANEWASSGVNVNAVAPGYIATDNTAALRDDDDRSKDLLARVPAGRWGEPSEIADPVVFLASDAARFMHGTTLIVDGGWLAR
ncbi:SDR family oxidoreductase [Stappia sp. ES.058]|uniref:SDR family oxidoreductase n=1 Tax=Stappia sp. ES.058 TaxID=1881061 RepID=UPI00087DC4B2|nr:SDR family oxidoreductase [Stappia sp. ES.058]SDU17960.1 2-deoxy-D-gluconate 3-dehydrogenase [Stappia sp. ES.058]